ncbi:hypothetical protein N7499_004603 [Penicillium canescens]|nr:hypothetical protein N7499_004603 [Penicillium canescens]KAJ6161761.1 hypothetical protein N7485_009991 [Penicillium canescens]
MPQIQRTPLEDSPLNNLKKGGAKNTLETDGIRFNAQTVQIRCHSWLVIEWITSLAKILWAVWTAVLSSFVW